MDQRNSVNKTLLTTLTSQELLQQIDTDINKEKEVLNTFCKNLSKINDLDECGWTPLYRTIIAGDFFASQILLNNGANPNIQCSLGETPLYQAVDMNRDDQLRLLINFGANINITQIDGLSPLHLAVSKQNLFAIKYLLKKGADPNLKSKIYEQSSVHLAIKKNVDPMILLLLVQFNGSLVEKDKFGKKPIDYINSKEMKEAVEKLRYDKEQNKSNLILKKFETPNKYNINFTVSKVCSNTIHSESSKELNLNGNTLLKDAGKNGCNNFFDFKGCNGKKNIDSVKKDLFSDLNNSKNNEKEKIYLNEENKENNNPNVKRKLINDLGIKATILEENSLYESEKNTSNNTKTLRKSIGFSQKNSIHPINNYSNIEELKNENSPKKNSSNFLYKRKHILTSVKKNKQKKYYINLLKKDVSRYQDDTEKSESNNKLDEIVIDQNNKNKHRKILSCDHFNVDKMTINDELNLRNSLYNFSDCESFSSEKNETPHNSMYKKPMMSNKYNYSNFRKKKESNEKSSPSKNKNLNIHHSIKNIFTFAKSGYNVLIENNNKKEEEPLQTISNIKNENYSTLINDTSFNYLWKFKSIEEKNNSKKMSILSMNTYTIDVSSINYPIYDFLKEINLTCYYNLFIEKKIFSFDKIIENLKNNICYLTKEDFVQFGITVPGHIYRILTKLEVDAEKIDKKIYRFLLINKSNSQFEIGQEYNILNSSTYFCCGCCSVNEKSNFALINEDHIKYQLDPWLLRIKMIKYKQNFIEFGFDMFEYFILQMFTTIPIDDNILKEELKITNVNDRDFILLQLNKDVKYIIRKTQRKYQMGRNIDKSPKNSQQAQKNEEESTNCTIF